MYVHTYLPKRPWHRDGDGGRRKYESSYQLSPEPLNHLTPERFHIRISGNRGCYVVFSLRKKAFNSWVCSFFRGKLQCRAEMSTKGVYLSGWNVI